MKDYVKFSYEFPGRIFHVHMKDVYWSNVHCDIVVFGGHTASATDHQVRQLEIQNIQAKQHFQFPFYHT